MFASTVKKIKPKDGGGRYEEAIDLFKEEVVLRKESSKEIP